MTPEQKLIFLEAMFPKGTLVKFFVGTVGNAWCVIRLDDKRPRNLPYGHKFETGFVASDAKMVKMMEWGDGSNPRSPRIFISSGHGLLTYSAQAALDHDKTYLK